MKSNQSPAPGQLEALVAPVLEICNRAGSVIRGHYLNAEPVDVQSKPDDTPLTRADLESHAIISAGLAALTPDIPVLSEESDAGELEERRSWPCLWMVDPLDGTKEFIARTGEFTINIAMIQGARPVLGIIYLPMTGEAFVGIPGSGAWRVMVERPDERSSLHCRQLPAGEPLIVLASRRHRGQRLGHCLAWLEQHLGSLERRNSGSALKFCDMAAGEGDFYPRFSLCSEWDVAAGDALLAAAGGAILGLDGQPLAYNCRDTLLSENFIAVADPAQPLWAELLRALPS